MRKRRRERVARVELASAEAAGDDAYFAADDVKAEAAAAAPRHRRRLDRPRPRRARPRPRARPADRVGAPARRLRPQGLAQRVRDPTGADRRSSTSGSPTARTTPRTASWSGCTAVAARRRDRPRRQRHQAQRLRQRAHHARGVLDPRPRRRPLDPALDRAGRRGRAPPRRADRRLAVVRRRSPARRGGHRARGRRRRRPTPRSAELVDVDYAGDGRTQALDLSVVDGRFAPAVLEAAARRAVEAWAEAVDGADAALERAATPEAAHALLYPRGESTRLVVRGPRLQALRIAALDAEASRRPSPSRPSSAAAATSRTATPPRCSRAPRTAPRRSPSAGRSRSATTPRRRGGSSRPPPVG